MFNSKNNKTLHINLPKVADLSQDEEYCLIVHEGKKQKVRIHDYPTIYTIPGFYEALIYDQLKCNSPEIISSLLVEQVTKSPMAISELKILELGSGNGMVGESLVQKGVKSIIGIDILEEAAIAAKRDRPHIYDKYYVEDMTHLSSRTEKELNAAHFNCLVCVAALGFGDIPPSVFVNAYNLIAENGWIAFTIKEDFTEKHDTTGFSKLLYNITENGSLDIRVKHAYQHRLSIDGKSLTYLAIIGQKRTNISERML